MLLVQDLEFEKGSQEEAFSLAQAQQSKLLRVSELENEITQLKEENKNLRSENTFQILNNQIKQLWKEQINISKILPTYPTILFQLK